jgi:hypothetical protein
MDGDQADILALIVAYFQFITVVLFANCILGISQQEMNHRQFFSSLLRLCLCIL